ncbi:tandem-95 repeat protein [Catenovulum sp. SM1970]|uniref:Ig-like domain-containing protein n=1 Tax=Marinifaba aquimaris TaxID=2741323 RepID=UPI00157163C9|nr:Ig-like domain-containing protein [Marinifaba aquimaris]NTS75633.1 tandem-95 repeat protein [Marinifaba aquimaris]
MATKHVLPQQGRVVEINGTAFAVVDGQLVPLTAEQLLAAGIELSLPEGTTVKVLTEDDQELLFGQVDVAGAEPVTDLASEIEAIQEAIQQGDFSNIEATAAGETSSGNNGAPVVQFSTAETIAEADYQSDALADLRSDISTETNNTNQIVSSVTSQAAPQGSINSIETDDLQPQITGAVSEPSATIQVIVDGVTYDATNNGDGTWTLTQGTIAPLTQDTNDITAVFTGTDGTATNASGTVNANFAPVAVADTATVAEDADVTINVLANDTDLDDSTLTVNQATASNGTVVINPDSTITYTPNENFNGTDVISYTVVDSTGLTATSTVDVTVTPVNDAPTVADEVLATDEDTALTVDLLANDTDIDGDDLSVISATATNGVVTLNPDGTVTYTPNENFNGEDTISYQVSDGQTTVSGNAQVTVNPVNDVPVVEIEDLVTDEDTELTFNALENAFDVDGDELSVSTAEAENGIVVINADNTITYTPNENYNGADTVTLTVADGNGGETQAQVNITINPVNDDPEVNNEQVTTDEDVSIDIDVLANDTDIDEDVLTISSAQAVNGSVVINDDNTITYTPNENYNGEDQITYVVSDGNGGEVEGSVSVTVNPVNDDPVANDDQASTLINQAISVEVLANDIDVDGDDLTITQASASNGQVVINNDGTLTYTPNNNFTGSDSISYTVSDGNGGIATANAVVTVFNPTTPEPPVEPPVNQAPTTNNTTAEGIEDNLVTVELSGTDSDSSVAQFRLVSSSANGQFFSDSEATIALNVNDLVSATNNSATIYFKPDDNFNGSTNFTYAAVDNDGTEDTSPATGTLNIAAVNDAPIANDDEIDLTVSGNESGNIITANDTDVDGDTLTISSVDAESVEFDAGSGTYGIFFNGYTVNLNQDGSYTIDTFEPEGQPEEVLSFTYQITDGQAQSESATVTLKVPEVEVNTAPTAVDDTIDVETSTTGNLITANDFDAQGDSLTIAGVTGNDVSFDAQANTYTVFLDGYQVTIEQDGSYTVDTYNDEAIRGDLSFSYTVTDGEFESNSATVTLDYNEAPTTSGTTATGNEDTVIGVTLSGSDSDGSVAHFKLTTLSANGTFYADAAKTTVLDTSSEITASGNTATIYFAPNADFNGTANFNFAAVDNEGTQDASPASGTVTVNAVADIADDTASTVEETAVTIDVLDNDSFDGSATISATTDGSKGTTAIVNGQVVYTPEEGFVGQDTFTYTVTSGGVTETADVTVNVTAAPNVAPTTSAASSTGNEDTVIGVTLSGSDSDGSVAHFKLTTLSANGTFYADAAKTTALDTSSKITASGNTATISFAPNADFNGTANFNFAAVDNEGTQDASPASGTVTVNAVADIADDTASTVEETAVTIDVLDNDSFDGSATISATTDGSKGTTAIVNGQVVYTPEEGFVGQDTFTYTVTSGGVTETADVTVNVTAAPNVAPTTSAASSTGNEDTVIGVTLSGSDSDGSVAHFKLTTLSANGTFYADAAKTTALDTSSEITASGNTATIYFAPNADFNGTANFNFAAVDNEGTQDASPASGTVTVNAVADIADDTASTVEETAVTIDVLDNDSFDGSATISATTDGSKGTTAIVNGQVVYTPEEGFVGQDTFTYTVTSGGVTETADVTVNVTAANNKPDAVDDTIAVNEGASVSGNILSNDSDPENDTLSITQINGSDITFTNNSFSFNVTGGTVTLKSNGDYTFAHDGSEPPLVDASFTYTVSDGNGGVDTATVTLDVTALNDDPVANNDSVTTDEDTAIDINVSTLLNNDTDTDGGTLTVTGVSSPSNGTVVLNNGVVTFTPAENFNGVASFDYSVSDGNGGADTATVTVNVTAVNDKPDAVNDTLIFNEGGSISGNLLSNDRDPENETLTITQINGSNITFTNGSYSFNITDGSVTLKSNGDYTITHDGSEPAGQELIFTYTVSDGNGGVDTANVLWDVTPVNDDPVANNDAVTTDEDTAIDINASTLLSNDFDSEDDTLTVTGVSNPSNGTVVLNNGVVTFTPAENFNGVASFDYSISDGNGGVNTATVTVNVTAVNDKPDAVDDTITVNEGASVSGNILSNDSDLENDALSITQINGSDITFTNNSYSFNVTGGTVTLQSNGDYTFAHDGSEPPLVDASFTYTVSDGNGGVDTATVTLDVAVLNDDPVANNDSVTTDEDTAIDINVSTLLSNDTDTDGGTLTVTGVSSPSNGTVVLNNGVVTFTPAENFNGVASFDYSVSDGNGGVDTATVTVNVTAVNDQPATSEVSIGGTEDNLVAISLSGTDVDGSIASFKLTALSDKGTFYSDSAMTTALTTSSVISATADAATIYFMPNADYNGSANFQYVAVDNEGLADSTPATGVISLTAVADIESDTASTNEDTSVTIDVLANDTFEGTPSLNSVTQGSNGTVVISNGQVVYTPAEGFSGNDSFSYTVTSGGVSETATVSVTVQAVTPPLEAVGRNVSESTTELNFDYSTELGSAQAVANANWEYLSVNTTLGDLSYSAANGLGILANGSDTNTAADNFFTERFQLDFDTGVYETLGQVNLEMNFYDVDAGRASENKDLSFFGDGVNPDDKYAGTDMNLDGDNDPQTSQYFKYENIPTHTFTTWATSGGDVFLTNVEFVIEQVDNITESQVMQSSSTNGSEVHLETLSSDDGLIMVANDQIFFAFKDEASAKSTVSYEFSISDGSQVSNTATGNLTLSKQAVVTDVATQDDDIIHDSGNIAAGAGNDFIFGGTGNDTIDMGAGDDAAKGDTGADTFDFNADSADGGYDVISDFNASEGDVLDLSDLLVGATNDEASLNNYLTFEKQGEDTIIKVDKDADGGHDLTIRLEGLDLAGDTDLLKSLVDDGNLKLG